MDFKEITSQSNEKIKWLKKLSQKKFRQQTREFTVENLTTIYDALKSGYDFTDLFLTQDFIKRNKERFEVLQKESKLKEYYLISEDVNKCYSQLDTPSGITAVYKARPSSFNDSKSVVYLNGINDPGNMGTILRSALAFDVPNIVLDVGCVDVHNSKVINAAKDAIFKINIIEDNDREWLKNNKDAFPIYAADAKNGVTLCEAKIKKPFCLVLGSETHGVDEEIIKLSSMSIRIDISDKIDSLNVASAAAILLHGLKGT